MKKSLILIFVLFCSCKMSDNKNLRQVEIKESIQGNWYYLLEESVSSTKDNYLKTYNEVYINNEKTFHYTELIGNLKPEEYIISKDSFFSRNYDGQMVFKGLIKNINDSDFELIFKSQVISYLKYPHLLGQFLV